MGGRVPVGLDSGQTEFDALGETGGAKTHTLTTAEMPSHNHTQNSHNHTQNSHDHGEDSHNHGGSIGSTSHTHPQQARWGGATGYVGVQLDPNTYANPYYWGHTTTNSGGFSLTINSTTNNNHVSTAGNQSATATNQNTGDGNGHNILQPYMALNYIMKAA
jgi:microcystin-dependent protein